MKLIPFEMERWQSTFEHRVEFNLSESGVHPLTVSELLALGEQAPDLAGVRLGYGQSNGSDELRARIAELYPGATERSVTVTTGGAEANFTAFWELASIGRPAAVMVPNYMQVPGLARGFDGDILPFRLREEDGWRPDLDELESALRRGAAYVLVTNPNNPTGVRLSPDDKQAITTLAAEHGAWVLADEVYQGAELDGVETASFWGDYDRVIVTNSLSKAYGIPGVRIGWAVGPDAQIERLWSRTDYTTIAPASLSDALARFALSETVRPQLLERTRGILRNNFQVLSDWMDDQGGLFDYVPPDAGAICMVRYHAPVPSMALAERLRTEHSLLVVPGHHFGIESTPARRLRPSGRRAPHGARTPGRGVHGRPGRMSPKDALKDLELLVRSRYGLIQVDNPDEGRIEALLMHLADRLDVPYMGWSRLTGLKVPGQPTGVYGTDRLETALSHVYSTPSAAIYHFPDVQDLLESDATHVARLKAASESLSKHAGAIVLSGPDLNLPESLKRVCAAVTLPGPTAEEFRELITRILRDLSERGPVDVFLSGAELDLLVNHLSGLTLFEAEKILTKAIIEDQRLTADDIDHVVQAKRAVIEKEGLLEYYPVDFSVDHVAGLEGFKGWLAKRTAVVTNPSGASQYGLRFPRGVLLVGVPGCGKSLSAKAVAAEWRLPLLRLDPSNLYNKFIGESERNFKRAMMASERMAPVVL